MQLEYVCTTATSQRISLSRAINLISPSWETRVAISAFSATQAESGLGVGFVGLHSVPESLQGVWSIRK